MINVNNLCKSFWKTRAVDHATFNLPKSGITIITGADGAGKSTIFKLLIGLLKRDAGDISLSGKEIKNDFSEITSMTGYMPEKFSLYPDLSVEENMNFFADIHMVPAARRETLKDRLLEKTGMIQFKHRKAGALSGGMKQKLALSTILLSAPELILLDEPTTGVDPLSRIEFFNIIDELKNEGKTIFISTPYLDEAEKGDYIIFINNGRVIKEGSLKQIKEDFSKKIYKILPRGNIYEIIKSLDHIPGLKENVYIRGKYLKYIQQDDKNQLKEIPAIRVQEEQPRLEDIYIYYERQAAPGHQP
jgi:ABC-2 type transport system ATP-binding protein